MTTATATAIGVGVATSVASSQINGAISGGGSGGSGGSGGTNWQQEMLTYHGASPYDTHPQAGQEQYPQKINPDVAPSKATDAKAATKWSISSTPTQGTEEETSMAKQDLNSMWADRLSKYLDYNTRQLGFTNIFNSLQDTFNYAVMCVIVYLFIKAVY